MHIRHAKRSGDVRFILSQADIPLIGYENMRKIRHMPVEWSVHGSELLIVDYSGEGEVVSIRNNSIAEAFTQLWSLIDKQARQDPEYKNLPLHAEREI